jgi:hypothetical protein
MSQTVAFIKHCFTSRDEKPNLNQVYDEKEIQVGVYENISKPQALAKEKGYPEVGALVMEGELGEGTASLSKADVSVRSISAKGHSKPNVTT